MGTLCIRLKVRFEHKRFRKERLILRAELPLWLNIDSGLFIFRILLWHAHLLLQFGVVRGLMALVLVWVKLQSVQLGQMGVAALVVAA